MKTRTKLAFGILMMLSATAQAACEYIIYPYTGANSQFGSHRLSSASDGKAESWWGLGGADAKNGQLTGVNKSIDVSSNNIFQPPGTILAAGGGIPFTQYANKVSRDPEMVFFRCTPDTAGQLYQAFSTNGDDALAGWHEAQDVPGAYLTLARNVALRITLEATGQVFTDIWQQVAMTNLDKDKDGNFLIKAKNFSPIRVELIKTADTRYGGNHNATYTFVGVNPNAYVVFRGPGLDSNNIKVGQAHRGGNWAGWYHEWPSVISLYNNGITVRRGAICQVTHFTPFVQLPRISAADIRAGRSVSAPFSLEFACESNVISGVVTKKQNVALGFLAPVANVLAAQKYGLTSGSAVTHLLDDAYGAPGQARGVGVRILRNGLPMNFLASDVGGTGTSAGWVPVLGGAQVKTATQSGVDSYQETFEARLERFSSDQLETGRYQAHAQILMRLQ
ncbi:fimbrial protein [Buttiauxella ferragutiae]|uniref:fimbrial protein n=1 Tax=Buttiauxella ferragutiae TaxID=82989 RepID=UPI002111897B